MAVTGKGQTRIVAALKRIQHHLPLPLLERPSNNGREFISWHQRRRLCFRRAVHVKRHVPVVGVLSSCTDVPPSRSHSGEAMTRANAGLRHQPPFWRRCAPQVQP